MKHLIALSFNGGSDDWLVTLCLCVSNHESSSVIVFNAPNGPGHALLKMGRCLVILIEALWATIPFFSSAIIWGTLLWCREHKCDLWLISVYIPPCTTDAVIPRKNNSRSLMKHAYMLLYLHECLCLWGYFKLIMGQLILDFSYTNDNEVARWFSCVDACCQDSSCVELSGRRISSVPAW